MSVRLSRVRLPFGRLLSSSAMSGAAAVPGFNSLLTAAYYNNAPWTSNATLNRFSPWVLVNPIAPGVTQDYDGSLVLQKISQTNRLLTGGNKLDDVQDYLMVGSQSWEGPIATTGSITLNGGRNMRIIGVDIGAVKISVLGFINSLYMEGCRADMTAGAEGDAFFFGGLTTSNTRDPNLPSACFQNMASKGQHGTNRDHNMVPGDITSGQNSVTLTSLQQTSTNQVTAVLASTPPGLTQPFASFTGWIGAGTNVLNVTSITAGHQIGSGMYVNYTGKPTNQAIDNTTEAINKGQISGTPGGVGTYRLAFTQSSAVGSAGSPVAMTANADSYWIGGAQISGVTSTNGTGFNQQFDPVSYDPSTKTLVMQFSSFAGLKPNDISGTGNTVASNPGGCTLWVGNNVAGEHSDFIQQDGTRMCKTIEIDRISPETAYCGIIIVDDPAIYVSRFNYTINKNNAPMDNGTEFMRIGNQAQGAGLARKEFYDCHAYLRDSNTLANMSPTTGDGAVIRVLGGKNTLTWTRAEFRGGVQQESSPYTNFADYNSLGFGYAYDATNYSGYVAPTSANLLDITYSGATTIAESSLGGDFFGTFDVSHNLGRHSAIIDLTVQSSNVQLGQWGLRGRKLVRGRTRFDYSTTPGGVASVTIRATIRGTAQYIERTFNFNVSNDVSPAGSNPVITQVSTVTNTAPSASTAYPNTSGNATPNATTVSIGTATAGRYILALATLWSGNFSPVRTITGVSMVSTTGGTQPMTKLSQRLCGLTNSAYTTAGLYIVDATANATDTTASFTFNATNTPTAGGMQIFTVTGLPSTSPHSFNFANNDAVGGSLVISVDVPTGGSAVIGCAYTTNSSNNKRQTNAIFKPATAGTYYIRGTVQGTTSGPLLWEYSLDGTNFTSVNSGGNTLTGGTDENVELSGGGGMAMVSASFGALT